MTTTVAPGSWTLLGIDKARGACDHCGRTIARRFRIQSSDGQIMNVGSTHAKQATGWSWTVAQAERAEQMARREAAAEADYPTLWVEARRQRDHENRITGRGGAAAEAVGALRDRNVAGDLVEFVHGCLRASQAAVGAAA
jgi:hypothetical protein